MTSLDPRSPLVLDTLELGRRPGSMRRLHRTIEAPDDLGTAVIGVATGSELELDVRLEAVMEGVLVSGTTRGQARGQCVRCLDDLEQPLEVSFQELFVYPDKARHREKVDHEEAPDEYELEDDLVDLESVLRDAVVLALPFQPVCSQVCPGLCAQCGARLADDPEHTHDIVDPRWAALQSLVPPASQSSDQSPDQKES